MAEDAPPTHDGPPLLRVEVPVLPGDTPETLGTYMLGLATQSPDEMEAAVR